MSEVMLKATSANGMAAFLAQELTPSQRERVIVQLTQGEARLMEGGITASERVPFSAMNRLTTVAAEVKNEPLEEFARRAGRFVADYGTQTVYKYVMILMTPQAILRAAPAAWGRIFDRGTLVVDVEKGRARIRLQEFTADRAGCARITGFFEFVGERSAPDLKVEHTACRLDRAPECVWDLVWTG